MYDANIDKPALIFSDYIEGGAIDQFYSAMKQEYAVKGALMPDAHKGYGLPIGGVVATRDMIVPSWVGYDIGCGVAAKKLECNNFKLKASVDAIYDAIKDQIPVGFNLRSKSIIRDGVINHIAMDMSPDLLDILKLKKADLAIGTLGGGNHFIEIGEDEEGYIWVIVHSGSRGPGHGCATHYMSIAGGGRPREGHYPFAVDSEYGKNYVKDLAFMLEYALLNRRMMIDIIVDILDKLIGVSQEYALINRNHNHAEFKDGLWIHRKGATHAEKGMWGVIPGNMRDGSFIVRGCGNPDSLCSSSHGAGRVLGRAAAKRELSVEDFIDTMHAVKCNACPENLDESPMAYKDIFRVMDEQKDLVSIAAHVKPIINVKG
jgi:tRNA-splicing ligase RtcB